MPPKNRTMHHRRIQRYALRFIVLMVAMLFNFAATAHPSEDPVSPDRGVVVPQGCPDSDSPLGKQGHVGHCSCHCPADVPPGLAATEPGLSRIDRPFYSSAAWAIAPIGERIRPPIF